MLHVPNHLGVHMRQLPQVKFLIVNKLTQLGILYPESEGLQSKLFLLNECVMLVEEPRNEEGLALLSSRVVPDYLVGEAGPHLPSFIGAKSRFRFACSVAFLGVWVRSLLSIIIMTEGREVEWRVAEEGHGTWLKQCHLISIQIKCE